jgi:hypothetical protein
MGALDYTLGGFVMTAPVSAAHPGRRKDQEMLNRVLAARMEG